MQKYLVVIKIYIRVIYVYYFLKTNPQNKKPFFNKNLIKQNFFGTFFSAPQIFFLEFFGKKLFKQKKVENYQKKQKKINIFFLKKYKNTEGIEEIKVVFIGFFAGKKKRFFDIEKINLFKKIIN